MLALFPRRRFSALPNPEEAGKVASPITEQAPPRPPPRRSPPVDPRTRRFFIAVGIAAGVLQLSSSIGVLMAINTPSEE
ncbi:hypothetical protein BASA82_000023 [Batrachochytrium salamandrivorans]|nr:hypothetical protein BASA82_000023 [Batrachochytrium salamandrivorans]